MKKEYGVLVGAGGLVAIVEDLAFDFHASEGADAGVFPGAEIAIDLAEILANLVHLGERLGVQVLGHVEERAIGEMLDLEAGGLSGGEGDGGVTLGLSLGGLDVHHGDIFFGESLALDLKDADGTAGRIGDRRHGWIKLLSY